MVHSWLAPYGCGKFGLLTQSSSAVQAPVVTMKGVGARGGEAGAGTVGGYGGSSGGGDGGEGGGGGEYWSTRMSPAAHWLFAANE